MKELIESLGVVIIKSGGLALLVIYPLIPLLLLYAGLQAVGRSLWSSGTRRRDRKDQEILQEILDAPRKPGDRYYRDLARRLK